MTAKHPSKDRESRRGPTDSGDQEPRVLHFCVRVGHEQIVVWGVDASAALEEARRRLCLELPRMWDVIQGLADDRFEVTLLDDAEAITKPNGA